VYFDSNQQDTHKKLGEIKNRRTPQQQKQQQIDLSMVIEPFFCFVLFCFYFSHLHIAVENERFAVRKDLKGGGVAAVGAFLEGRRPCCEIFLGGIKRNR